MLVCEGQVGGIRRDRMVLKRMLHNKKKRDEASVAAEGDGGAKGDQAAVTVVN